MSNLNCVCCGAKDAMVGFDHRSRQVAYKGLTRSIHDLAGRECSHCGEVEFSVESAVRYAQAGDELIEDAQRAVAAEMKRIRRKLHLTQQAAVKILSGGGHNAFSRYERAEVEPPKPLFVLMSLLDRHPDLVEEVKAMGDFSGLSSLLEKHSDNCAQG